MLEDDERPEVYFARVEEAVAGRSRWKVRRQVTLAFLSFTKHRMWLDLDPASGSVAGHAVIRELFEGTEAEVAAAEEYNIDSPELPPNFLTLVHDADSSQHSALIDAVKGKNLVIEGPPGTGKSQTITNLIAASLAAGKTVLFVSEKPAALQVVKDRLDRAGLGDFVLELHSHKTRRQELLGALEKRTQARNTYRDTQDLNPRLALGNRKKQTLIDYVNAMNRPFGEIMKSPWEIVWACDNTRRQLPEGALGRVDTVFFPGAERWSQENYDEKEHLTQNYAHHAQAVLRGTSIKEHPWYGIGNPGLTFLEEQGLVRILSQVLDGLQELKQANANLLTLSGWQVEETMSAARKAAAVCQRLPVPQGSEWFPVFPCLRESTNREFLEEFLRRIEDWRAKSDRLRKSFRSLARLTDPDIAVKARVACAEAIRRNLGLHTLTSLRKWLESTRLLLRHLQQAARFFKEVCSALSVDTIQFTLESGTYLMRCMEMLGPAPWGDLPLRHACLENERAREAVREAAKAAEPLRKLREDLGKHFDLQSLPSPRDLRIHAARLREAGIWQRLFGTEYREAKRMFRRLSLHKRRLNPYRMAAELQRLADYQESLQAFHPRYQEMLGKHPRFAGIDTPWERLLRLVDWYEKVFEVLPAMQKGAEKFRRAPLDLPLKDLKAAAKRLENSPEDRTAFLSVIQELAHQEDLSPDSDLGGFLQRLGQLIEVQGAIERNLDSLQVREDVPIQDIPGLLDLAAGLEYLRAEIDGDRTGKNLLGEYFRGVATDEGSLRATLDLAESLADADLPEPVIQWLFSDQFPERRSRLEAELNRMADRIKSVDDAVSSAVEMGKLDRSVWFREEQRLGEWIRRLSHAVGNQATLSEWVLFIRAGESLRQHGLRDLASLVEKGCISATDVLLAWRFMFHHSLLREALRSHPLLDAFSRLTHEQVRSEYQRADKETIELYRRRVAHRIDNHCHPPAGRRLGPIKTWTDLALVQQQCLPNSRHIAIRQLLHRAGAAIQVLKPCFMMGPLSVAQYLELGRLRFDLVVMDEASQLPPEEALGAIARAKQAVVVGDPKQLPPTTFFQRNPLDDEDGEDQTAAEDSESILDAASKVYQPTRDLRWHYRSRHDSLIAFSNQEFYDGKLIVFPSAYERKDDLGVKYRAVTGGVFQNRRNPVEAGVVIEAIVDHARNRPKESLGVATMNFPQQELLEELLDQRLRDDPFAQSFVESMYNREEPLFIKNLENVQGDERDAVFISVTYGPPHPGGQINQNWGPITHNNGWRRLNVLFTRAKKRVVVFSSMDPDLIRIDPGVSRGVTALKNYLAFAKTGVLHQPNINAGRPSNDFELSVGCAVEQAGFEVIPQVGVAGYFIDLAVRHPQRPGKFLLGIECDGVTYHKAKSARDRDRLRQRILEDQGWRIHRIWSTDWFRNRASEVARMINRLKEVLAEEGPSPEGPPPLEHREEDAHQRLLQLRREIAAEFPDTPPQQALLRDELLESLLRQRPVNRDDWFKRIDRPLRENTDGRHISRYLDKVLEILSDI